jgi:hypothetical protein
MKQIIENEKQVIINGLTGRALNVYSDDKTGLIVSQKMIFTRDYTEEGKPYRIKAELRFDDECGNSKESFSITGDIGEYKYNGAVLSSICGGCIHEEITKHFPELAHLVKWHLYDVTGPMHYLANTIYHASDRDYNGLKRGQASQFSHGVKFAGVPITHILGSKFFEFLQGRQHTGEFKVLEIAHDNRTGDGYKFAPKYTILGFGEKWHECPFDSEIEAREFCQALNTCKFEFVKIPVKFSEGKTRDLNAARNCAVWPEATDDQLTQEPDELKKLLLDRLPGLNQAFINDMQNAGFVLPKQST